jgi:DNA invertase Pin-like site-specific DNA recombinase
MKYMTSYHVKGWTSEQVSQVLRDQIPEGKTYSQCYYFSNRYLHRPFTPARKKQHARILEMGQQIEEMLDQCLSYADIAEKFNLSKQRIYSIMKRYKELK